MDTVERILHLMAFYKMSARGFSIKCGISPQTLDNQTKRKRAVSLETLTAIASSFEEVSRDWLFMGEGEMLKSQNTEMARVIKLVDTITTLQDAINVKSDTIAALNERIKQLESQLSTK